MGPDGASFYSYGGFEASIDNVSVSQSGQNALWKFTPGEKGTGSWAPVAPPAFSTVRPSISPAVGSAASGNGIGYFLGGGVVPGNDEQQALQPLPGLLSYNMTSNEWRNDSATGLSPTGTAILGRMHFLPTLGSNGLLVALGGEAALNTTYWPADSSTAYAFDKIAIYDPSTKNWFHQRASGATNDSVPSVRSDFCSVGVSGDNGTYEMFVLPRRPVPLTVPLI